MTTAPAAEPSTNVPVVATTTSEPTTSEPTTGDPATSEPATSLPDVERARTTIATSEPTTSDPPASAPVVDVERARATIAAVAPRRLRLAELLRELGASDGTSPTLPRPAQVTVGELVDKAAEAGFGFLVGILALIAIPFFGLSTPFGLAIALIGGQLLLGNVKPWLPRRARRRALQMTMLDRVLGILTRRTRWLARSTRRRWELVIRTRLVGLGIVILALGLALPLPIPGSNLIFLIPIFVYAIGLLERDGLWIALGHLAVLINVAVLFVFGSTVVAVFERLAGCFQ